MAVSHQEAGDPLDTFLTDFPTISREQAVAVLKLAKEMLRERVHAAQPARAVPRKTESGARWLPVDVARINS